MINSVICYDIETYDETFIVVAYIPGEYTHQFEVSAYKNELDSFVKFTEEHSEYYWVGYNSLRFDSQVVEWILRNYEYWHDISSLEICAKIAQKAQDTINDANYDVFPEYREYELTLKQIDLFKVLHYDNKHRRIGLKVLEFEMNMENIEEMPIPFNKKDLTKEETELVCEYCKNDVKAVSKLYKITIGETDHPLYKENNQIQLRQDIEEEFDIKCLNYSDSKIGDEIIKKFYCEEKRIKYNELPIKGTFRKSIEVKNCIAKYIQFKTPQLKKFLEKIRKISLKMQDDINEKIEFYGNTYSFMKGGLHTENKPKIYEATEDLLIIDWDVSSYYPAIIINNEKYPAHLGKEFLRGYKHMFERRLEMKPLAKNDKRIEGIVNALKLAVNSVYGKSSDMQNWVYDKQLTLFTCITGELSLMMLIEKYELNGIRVISANTDGVTVIIPKEKIDKMYEINDWWISLTGYELERTDYQKIVFSTVNDYIAIKTNGEIKQKGDFLTDFELHKNKSARIVPIALKEYYLNNVPIEVTIMNHKNIYDFCIRQKSSKDFHYEGFSVHNGNKTVYNKLIRYYVSNEGEKILKIKNPECTTNAPKSSQIEAGLWKCFVCNKMGIMPLLGTKIIGTTIYNVSDSKYSNHLSNVDYNYYIERANKIMYKISSGGKNYKPVNVNQLTLNFE